MIRPVIGRPPEAIAQGVELLKSNPAGCFGPWLMALVSTTFMLGVLATQATKYFSLFGYESTRMFAIVMSCIILSILQWIVLVIAEWDWFVVHYGDWSRFAMVPWYFPALEVATRLTVFVAQIFFAQRCYALYDRSKVVFAVVMVGMVASLVLFALVSATEAIDPYNVPLLERFMMPALCISLGTDLLITGLTLWKLGRHKGQSLGANTDDVIRRLRNVTLEAAAPPALSAFFNLALCWLWTNYTYHWFGIMTPKLYVWSLMFTLNSRVAIREKFNSPNQDDRTNHLSTGFEFARFSRLNRKARPNDSDPNRTTFFLSALSRPPQISGGSSEMTTDVDATESKARHELLSKDAGHVTSQADANRQRVDLDQRESRPHQDAKDDSKVAHPLSRRKSEPSLKSTVSYRDG